MSPATYLVPLALALALSFATEATTGARRPSLKPADLAVRLSGYALVALFWFQFSWRPWLALSSCGLTFLILAAVDRLKRRVIGEPPVFSDLALLAQVPRHPDLYYVPPLTDPRMAGPILLGLAGIAAWYAVEPAALPVGTGAALLAIVGLPTALALLVAGLRTSPGRALVRRLFPKPDLAADVARYGIAATMMGYALRRCDERVEAGPDRTRVPSPLRGGVRGGGGAEGTAALHPEPPSPPTSSPQGGGVAPCSVSRKGRDDDSLAPGEPDDAIFVVVQLESFLDPARLGGPPLPAMDRIRAEATRYGRLAVPAHGAYTMRAEHAVLTGLTPENLGFGRYDPYLARGGEEPTSLARLARAAGFATTFVHPFHRDFFDRARVFRRLGFDRLVMEEDFSGAPRIGPYIGDEAVAERILAEIEGPGRRFVFAVTMENHGPWKPGRLPGLDTPLALYLHHVAGTGRAVERLIDGLKGRRATLCVFGDHAPSLPECRPRPEGPVPTDYALFRFRGGAPGLPVRADLDAAELGCLLRDALLAKAPGLRGQA